MVGGGEADVLPVLAVAISGRVGFVASVEVFRPTHVLAIRDPGSEPVAVPADIPALHLAFWDLDYQPTSGDPMHTVLSRRGPIRIPEADDIVAILAFTGSIPPGGRLLCTCGAGRSRSAAAAVAAAAQRLPGRETEAVAMIREIRPDCRPNNLMVRLIDAGLGAGGRLIDAVNLRSARGGRG